MGHCNAIAMYQLSASALWTIGSYNILNGHVIVNTHQFVILPSNFTPKQG